MVKMDTFGNTQEVVGVFYNLGKIIDTLLAHGFRNLHVVFDANNAAGYYSICGLSTWRGSYALPCINFKQHKHLEDAPLCAEIGYMLKRLMCKEHYGYKGGEYKFSEEQEPYIARDYSETGSEVKIVEHEVSACGKMLILKTAQDVY